MGTLRQPLIRCSLSALGTAVLASVLPAQEFNPRGPWKVERSKRGDTTIVRTVSGSVWGERVALVEELRIGSREGDGPESFGFIQSIAFFPSGVIAVFDGTVPAVRLFTPDGKYLRTLGRDGAGPGEYRNQTLGLAVDHDGVLLMYDPRNARINRWKEDGTVLPSWPAPGRLFTSQALQIGARDQVYVKVMIEQPEPGQEWKIGLARMTAAGATDTMAPPKITSQPTPGGGFFSPVNYWYLTRSGALVAGYAGEYAITHTVPGRPPLRMERLAPRVRLEPAERRNYQEVSDARARSPNVVMAPSPPVPAEKPYFRSVQSDLDGRIWVDIHGPGEAFEPDPPRTPPPGPPVPPLRWREPRRFDVFDQAGAYLGRIELPRRTTLAEAKGNQVWALQRGEDDEHYIVRYRITGLP